MLVNYKRLVLMWCPKCCKVFGFTGDVDTDIYCGACKSHKPMQSVVADGPLFQVEDHA